MSPAKSLPTSSKHLGSPDVLVFEATESFKDSKVPSLIVLFGWMDATLPLLVKYVQGHKVLFPGTTILLVKSSSSFMIASEAQRERTLAPLADLILDRIYYTESTRGILFHVISNGGGFQLIYLSNLLSRSLRRRGPVSTSPPIGIIIDSAPGSGEYVSMIKTFIASAGIRSPVLKAVLPFPIALLYVAYVVMITVRGTPPLLPLLRVRLLEAEVVPTADRETPRLYVFSDTDEMVADVAVEAHLKDIAKSGLSVRVEKYSGSQHVSHMKKDTERYWRAVREVWEKARKVASERALYKSKL